MEDKQPLADTSAPPAYAGDPKAQPPPGQPPVATATHTTVVTQPVVVQQSIRLGELPVTVICPTGGHQITTEIRYESGTMTWLIAAVLCFVVGICFAWIPFVINDLKDVVHVCPIDGTIIGVYKRM